MRSESRKFSSEDIDTIRAQLLDGDSSPRLAAEYDVPQSILLRAARGKLEYDHDATHPSLTYDFETGEWSIPEERQEDSDPEPYTYEGGKLLVPTFQAPPWATDADEEESSENQSTDTTNETEATQTTMTNTTTTDDSTETELHTTIGRDKNGKTVGGTSPDDFGSISTDCWPSHIDPTDVSTELRRRIIQVAAMHRDWDLGQVVERLGCSRGYARKTLKEHWPEHPVFDRDENLNAAFTVEEVDELRRRLVAGEPRLELADEYDVSVTTIKNAAEGTAEYMAEAEHPSLVYDHSAGQWVIAEDYDPESGTEDTTDDAPTPPESLDLDDLSREPERSILIAAVENPDWNQTQISKHVGCLMPKASNALRVYWPTHPSVQSSDRSEPFTAEDVNEIRNRLLDGESLSDLSEAFNTSEGIISNLAKGEYSLGDAAEIPELDYDQKAGGWLLASDVPETEQKPEPEPSSTCEMAVLAYGADVYHHRDESGMAACGAWSDGRPSAPLVTLERDEAETVAEECSRCSYTSRSSAELLDDIRAELGASLKDEGTPLTRDELANVLYCLRKIDRHPLEEVSA